MSAVGASMSGMDLAIETHGLVKIFGEQRAVDGVDLAIPTRWGLRRPRAQRRRQDHHDQDARDAARSRTAAPRPCSATTSSASRRPCGRGSAMTGQFASLDEDLTGTENLVLLARLYGYSAPAARDARGRAARGLRPRRRGEEAGQGLLRRHAPSHRHRRLDRRPARPDVPRRADHRPRPAQPQPGVGDRPRPGRRRHDGAAHHPVPRGGRPAGRPDRGHRPRPGDRRGHQRRAQGVGRLRRRARPGAPTRPTAPTVARLLARVARRRAGRWSPTRPRSACASTTRPAWPARSTGSASTACGSPSTASVSPASTRCSSP